jgi:hypothetical protein
VTVAVSDTENETLNVLLATGLPDGVSLVKVMTGGVVSTTQV